MIEQFLDMVPSGLSTKASTWYSDSLLGYILTCSYGTPKHKHKERDLKGMTRLATHELQSALENRTRVPKRRRPISPSLTAVVILPHHQVQQLRRHPYSISMHSPEK
ncbi:capsular exopolysaccharide family protein [Striga asiatica]|uniref:Capsular exopolysaccharide family protein n=1 Tax=Striga asiatica TaxID=4170 RepID=A0A5A7PLL9_STRAF|nr:capsular exopolysaccharide family protein [Striga asiatica]